MIQTLTRLATLVDRCLQLLIRPHGRQVAWVSSPDYVGNSYHLFRHMMATRSGIRHVWLVADEESRLRLQADLESYPRSVVDGSPVLVIRRHSIRGYLTFLRSQYVFHTHGIYRMTTTALRGRRIVSLWHGMPIKCIGALNTRIADPYPTFGTDHLATSAVFRAIIAAAFRADFDRVILSALPRCDALVAPLDLAPSRDRIRDALQIPPSTNLVMWLPTYRTAAARAHFETGVAGPQTFLDDLDEWQLPALDDIAGRHRCTIVVKLHHDDPLNNVDLDLQLANVRFMRAAEFLDLGVELYDVLAFADGLITDVSSVIIDFLTTSRPAGVLGFDPATYTRDVVIPPAALINSRRVHDMADREQFADFFSRVESRTAVDDADDDLRHWLQHDAPGHGCETVLDALGL